MKILTCLISLLALVPAAASAQDRDPSRLFPREAPVTDPPAGLARLPLTAEVLEAARSDLSDVRLYDGRGREVPYLVDAARRRPADEQRYVLSPEEVSRSVEDPSGIAPRYRERIVVRVPPAAGHRALGVSAFGPFVRAVTVRDRADGSVVARGSVFRLTAPRREGLRIQLPGPSETSSELEVELVGEGGYLEPSLALIISREPVDPPTLEVALEPRLERHEDGVTVLELSRPPGMVPDRLRLRTSTEMFAREVRVQDASQGRAPRHLGARRLFRVRGVHGAEQLEVPLDRAQGGALRVEIVDRDSPPLEDLEVVAEIRRPALVFVSDGATHRLRFGGARTRAPAYDVATISGRLRDLLLSSGSLQEATLGPVRDNPRFDDAPALDFAMTPGREIDASRFRHVADLTVEEAPEGLSRVRLPPSVLAAASKELDDLRIVDAEGRQRPYLRGEPERSWLGSAAGAPETSDRRSRYRIALPAARATVNGLRLDTDAAYLSRPFELRGIDTTGRWVTVHRGSLDRDPDRTGPLEMTFAPRRLESLELVVADGDDAPIAWTDAELSIERPTVFLAAPAGRYRALVGDPSAEPPRYEIDAARDLVLAVRASEARASEARPNPAHVEPPWWEASSLSSWLVWAVLLLAMLVLGLLTWRVARQPPDEPRGGDPDAEATGGEAAGEPPDDPEVGPSEPVAF